MKSSRISHKDSQQYFTVTADALLLFAQNKTSALAICSYLVLSRYRKKSSNSTAASANALCNVLNIGASKAKKAICELLNCKADDETSVLSNHIPNYNFREAFDSDEECELFLDGLYRQRRRKVKSRKFDFMNVQSSILISNSLIDGNCEKLKYLIRNNDHRACLMLLVMHFYYDYNLDSIKIGACSIQCHDVQDVYEEKGIVFCKGILDKDPSIPESIYELILGQNEFKQLDVNRLFLTLEHAGLMKRVICVFMRPRGSNSEQHFYYELDIKTNDPSEKLSCHNLAHRMREFVQDRGHAVGRKDNRFYNEYVFAAPSDNEVAMMVLYRLPFAMRNMKNLDVQEGVKFRQQNHEQVCKWIDIAAYNGIS